MSSAPQDLDALDPRVNRALQDFLERMDRGEAVDPEQFLLQHGDIADQLRSFIADAADLARRVTPDTTPAAEISTNRSVSETIPPSAPGAAPALPEVFGRYRVIRLLGRGAMGAVYLADDTQLARQVALKVPHFDQDQSEELLQRFYREARTAATLRNPHICPVYDVGEIGGQHYISMAYIEGHPLSEIIKAKGAQPERQVLTLIRKLALALQDAHNQGVIHRDLKPGNVMVDARGEPVVTDFGLACQVREGAERLTHSGVILGSPAYMSPEQLEGSSIKVTPSADQYALGVMLYELLTGQLPFRGTISAVVGQIITKPAPAPKILRPELDPRVNELCLQMLAKTPAERFGSMKAVAERILSIMKEPTKVESPVKPPAPVAPAEPSSKVSDPSAETMAPNGANPQQQVIALIKQGELQAALEVLGTLAQRKSGKLADWARQKQTEVRELLEVRKRDQAALCLLAGKLIRKSDYAEAIRVLSEVPVASRTDELSDLLSDAEAKEEESALLLQDIETAVRKDQPKELPALVKRFLQLKPGNKAIRTLAEDLKRYGAEKVVRFRRNQRDFLDPAEATWNPMHAVYFVSGLALVCAAVYLAAIAFQTPNGTVIIEVHDPRVVVNFANDEITATSSGKTYRLKTTEKKTLQLEIDGVTVDGSTQEITVEQNETKIITAKLIDGKLDLAINKEKRSFAVPDALPMPPKVNIEVKEHVGEWIDILAATDPASLTASNHQWKREGKLLTATLLPPTTNGWVAFVPAQEIKGDYDLELDFLVIGTGYVQLGLPLDDTIATLSLGEAGTGLHWIDGKDLKDNMVRPTANPQGRITRRTVQHVTASVRHHGENVTVETKLEGVDSGHYSGPRSRITTPKQTAPKPRQLKLVSPFDNPPADHRIELHQVRVRLITPAVSNEEDWTPLFNGKNFANWAAQNEQVPFDPAWQIKNGILEITPERMGAKANLWSSEIYEDFELRMQYRVLDEGHICLGLHSGFQDVRRWGISPRIELSYFRPQNGDSRVVAGDLYAFIDEKPNTLVKVPDAQRTAIEKALRKGEWIDVYVRCEGPRIIADLNGIRTVDYNDESGRLNRNGTISLHSGGYPKVAAEIRKVDIRHLNRSKLTSPVIAPDATVFNGHSYKFYPQPLSWTQAKRRCEEMGGHLPIIKTPAENDFILQFGKGRVTPGTTPGIPSAWLGMTDAAKEGDWRWVNGSPVTFQKWGRQQPNNKQNQEHYGLMYLQDGGNITIHPGEWCDQPDQSVECAAYFICEWDSIASTTPTSPPKDPPIVASTNSTKSSTVLLDADFRKGPMDFAQGDYDFLLAQHKDGEYRYMGKKPGWWFGSLHSEFWKPANNQLRDFAIELDVRIATPKRGVFGVEFGRSGDATVTLGLNQLGQLRLIRGSDQEIVPWTTSREMRPVSQFNTIRLEVQNKVAKVTVNGKPLFEKPLERYSGGVVSLWLNPEEPPFDVRIQRVRLERLGPDEAALRDREIRRFKGHTGVIRGVAFLPDGQRAVSVGHEKAFKLWDVANGNLLHDFTGHTEHVTSVSVSGDGKRALTGCWDKQVRLWDLEERKLLKTLKGHVDKVVSVQISRDGMQGLSVSNDGVIRRWDLKAGKSTVVPGPAPYGVIALNPAENVIASGNGDGTVVLRGQQGIAPLIGHGNGYVEGLAFTPDGSKLVTGGDDGTVRVWDLNSGKELHRFVTDGAGFDTVAVTNDGRYVLAGSSDYTIVSWDILTGDKVATIHADSPVTHRFALSPDNMTVLSGGGDIGWKPQDDYDLRLWKLPSPPAPK